MQVLFGINQTPVTGILTKTTITQNLSPVPFPSFRVSVTSSALHSPQAYETSQNTLYTMTGIMTTSLARCPSSSRVTCTRLPHRMNTARIVAPAIRSRSKRVQPVRMALAGDKKTEYANQLDALKLMSKVVADTGDFKQVHIL